TYDIVGDGYNNETDKLLKLSKKLNLLNIVKIHGRIPNTEIKPFFDKCNIGVSFVPIQDRYEFQPVTKTFEYVMSGLYTIATCTYENKKVINDVNGILIKDSDDDFCRALEFIVKNRDRISALDISDTLVNYKWSEIVNNTLYPLLTKLEKKWF
ncbi:MAG: glycosyltransferase, partial [Prolixibacteraceae bacterium]|nr:glycosyltransferase [Prolixibacteraceae bacterium]